MNETHGLCTRPLDHRSDNPEKLGGRFAFIDVNIHSVQTLRNGARKQDDRNVGLDLFHLARQFGPGGPVEHVISDGRADRELAKSLEGFIGRSRTNNLISFSLEDLFSEHKVSRAILDAEDKRPRGLLWQGKQL